MIRENAKQKAEIIILYLNMLKLVVCLYVDNSKKTDENSTDKKHAPQFSASKAQQPWVKNSNIYQVYSPCLLQSLSIFLAGLNME